MKSAFMKLPQRLYKKKSKLHAQVIVPGYGIEAFIRHTRNLLVSSRVDASTEKVHKMLAYADVCFDQYPTRMHQSRTLRQYFCLYISIMDENAMVDRELSDWGGGPHDGKLPGIYGIDNLHAHPETHNRQQAQNMPLHVKQKFCAFIYHNKSPKSRNRLYEILSTYKRVDALGDMFRNTPSDSGPRNHTWMRDAIEKYRPYKFSVTFENSIGAHYHSEKIQLGFVAGTVPIYWGCPYIAKYYNPDAFINAYDFESLESLAKYVMKVDKDDSLYQQYLVAPKQAHEQRRYRAKIEKRQHNFASNYPGSMATMAELPNMQANSFLREIMSRSSKDPSYAIFGQRLQLVLYRGHGRPWPYR